MSNPYPSPRTQNIFGQNTVVDIQAKVEGETTMMKEMPAMDSITESKDGTIVADNREAMLSEIENLARTSRQIVESAPLHEKLLAAYEGFTEELNPKLAKEREREERIAILEERMSGMDGKITDIHKLLLSSLKSKEPSKQ